MSGGSVFFASDVHIGSASDAGRLSERRFLSFLSGLPEDTSDLYLLGDIFDFRVEYRDLIPKDGIRVLGALAALSDRGVRLHYICGNHDYWLSDWFEKEFGAEIIRASYVIRDIGGRNICFGHGDGLGRRSIWECLIFRLFRSKICISFMKGLPPRWLFSFARSWSALSRCRHCGYVFKGADDPLYRFADNLSRRERVDAFIFGHLHTPVCASLPDGTPLHVLGDWSEKASYLNLSGM